jgi:hypothetical protein
VTFGPPRCAICGKPLASAVPNGMTPLCSVRCRDQHFRDLGLRPPIELWDRSPEPGAGAGTEAVGTT